VRVRPQEPPLVAKYAIKRVTFREALSVLASRNWTEGGQQGGVKAARFDENLRMVELDAPRETIRVPAEAVSELVLGVTVASKQP
jgi:DNA-binding FadR family transcriptional regulator